ncbi:hypothetical protein CAC42_6503 [Sphaceloma murrayae]|uniref:Ras-GEF domain-containing protein n=1 Tax=Sphaceloma murrayae TaxID=2082308 RepID=A0A2K1QGI1_9PEZI|nr:hypothetical protein CAC42_6503 [Sphaceloma murrayae]
MAVRLVRFMDIWSQYGDHDASQTSGDVPVASLGQTGTVKAAGETQPKDSTLLRRPSLRKSKEAELEFCSAGIAGFFQDERNDSPTLESADEMPNPSRLQIDSAPVVNTQTDTAALSDTTKRGHRPERDFCGVVRMEEKYSGERPQSPSPKTSPERFAFIQVGTFCQSNDDQEAKGSLLEGRDLASRNESLAHIDTRNKADRFQATTIALPGSETLNLTRRRRSDRSAPLSVSINTAPSDFAILIPRIARKMSAAMSLMPSTNSDVRWDGAGSEPIFADELVRDIAGEVVGGTPRALLEHLVNQAPQVAAKGISALLLTFDWFMSAVELAGTLINHYQVLSERSGPPSLQQKRVLDLMGLWLSGGCIANVDTAAVELLYSFATDSEVKMPSSIRKELVEAIDESRTKSTQSVVCASKGQQKRFENKKLPPLPLLTKPQLLQFSTLTLKGINLTDLPPLEVARQLTLLAVNIFNTISARDLLSTLSSRSCPHSPVLTMSAFSTSLTHLVTFSILTPSFSGFRAHTLEYWIKVANCCCDLQNYDSLMAIFCGLDSGAISRLKKTWALVPDKRLDRLDDVRRLCDFSRNFSAMRKRVREAKGSCLPFLGLILTDLTFLEAGNAGSRMLGGDGGRPVVNFEKYTRLVGVCDEVTGRQGEWAIEEVRGLGRYLEAQMREASNAIGEKGWIWERSYEVEPREINERFSEREGGRDRARVTSGR